MARAKGRDWLTRTEFVKESGVSLKQILKYFDKWNEAVIAAGLVPLGSSGRPGKQRGLSEEELIERIKATAMTLGKNTLTVPEFKAQTGISGSPIYRLFKNWNEALEKAGLQRNPNYNLRIPDDDLFEDYFRVTSELNRFPTYNEFARRSKYSIGVYEHRFENFTEFRKQAMKIGLDKGSIKSEFALPTIESLESDTRDRAQSFKLLDDRPILGERINFRGLIHAPVNELGVVYLFGILSKELGFEVESIRSEFPDCEATRRIGKNKLQRVRIEFEFQSSNFVRHGHDITKCDMVVCWEHDWKNCPLEVISLKERLAKSKHQRD